MSFPVPAEVTATLLGVVPGMFNAGVNEILLAGLVAAIGEWRGRPGGLLIDVEGHGRTGGAGDLSRTVGGSPACTRSGSTRTPSRRARYGAADPRVSAIVKRAKERMRSVPGDGLGYGLLRHCDPESRAALAEHAAPQVAFNYLGRFATGTADGHWQPETMGGQADAGMPALHALEASVAVRDLPGRSELTLSFAWLPEIVGEAGIDELRRLWPAMLAGIAAHAERPGARAATRPPTSRCSPSTRTRLKRWSPNSPVTWTGIGERDDPDAR